MDLRLWFANILNSNPRWPMKIRIEFNLKSLEVNKEFQSLISLEGCQKEQCLSCWPNHTGNNHLCCFNSYACCWVIWKRLINQSNSDHYISSFCLDLTTVYSLQSCQLLTKHYSVATHCHGWVIQPPHIVTVEEHSHHALIQCNSWQPTSFSTSHSEASASITLHFIYNFACKYVRN